MAAKKKKPKAKALVAVDAGVVAAEGPNGDAPDRDYVVKRGQLMVVPGEIRGPGDIVKRDELTPEEAKKFLARGTIGIQGA